MKSMSPSNTFYLLDLDRTLFDTPLFTDNILSLVAEYDVQVAQELAHNVADTFARGGSFAIREEIALRLGEEKTARIEAKVLEKADAESLFLDGAQEALSYIAETPELQAGILTYGEPKGQTMKLQAAQLTGLPHLITDSREKGSLIRSWRKDNGDYQLPEVLSAVPAAHVVLVDDRLISFQGLPDDARGYWLSVQPPSAAEVSVLAANVMVIRSLYEFIEAERHIDKT
jgi:FMN phosphatase YigB (HAD superfamily)